jgi:predicted dehydrogenase
MMRELRFSGHNVFVTTPRTVERRRDDRLRVAVLGAGVMGSNHARILSTMSAARLAVVVDADADRAQQLASRYGSVVCASVDELDGVDAAIVATPTPSHPSLASALMRRGIHVLVEKPLAPSSKEALDLVSEATGSGVILATGFVERFNPVCLELPSLLDRPLHIDATRISPYSTRITDGVVMDLMIHDVDLVLSLLQSPVVSVSAVIRSDRSSSEDLAVALLTCENGSTASLTASRIGQNKIRSLRITQTDSVVEVDLLRQHIELHRVDHVEYSSDDGRRYRQSGVVEIPFLEHRGEPLALELNDFVRAVVEQRAPRVTGADGVRAIAVVERILAVAQGTSTRQAIDVTRDHNP